MTRTILIVEDEPDLAGLLRDVLTEGGFYVVLSTASAAAAKAMAIHPSAIVIDYVMPGLNGGDVLRQMRTQTPDTMPPVILVTGREEASHLATDLGADAYLRKPFDVDELVNLVEDLTSTGKQ